MDSHLMWECYMSDDSNFVTINTSLLMLHTDKPIKEDANKLKGYIANQFRDYPIFHNHYGNRCLFTDSRIQYKIINGNGYVLGIKEGTEMIKLLSDIKELHLGNSIYSVRPIFCDKEEILMKTDELIQYDFKSPWAAFNDDNYEIYKRLYKAQDFTNIKLFLNNILRGNMISLCKAFGLYIKGEVYVQTRLKKVNLVYKVKRPAFIGEFRANIAIPDFFGIGGKVSTGFGVVKRRLDGDHYLGNTSFHFF